MEERLQKLLSRAGVASRRKSEEIITSGRVTVNGEVVTELGSKADLEKGDAVKVDGKLIQIKPEQTYYLMLNKPRGCVTTTEDPEGRQTVTDLVGPYKNLVYPVGRLDFHSEGLLILTNDGDFANHLLTAKSELPKTYLVKVNGILNGGELQKFRRGIPLDGRPTAPAKIRMSKVGPNPWYEVTLNEGRNRQIRRMFQALGYLVEKIRRVRYGPLELGKLNKAEFRPLTDREIWQLEHPAEAMAEIEAKQAKKRGARKVAGPKPDDHIRRPRKAAARTPKRDEPPRPRRDREAQPLKATPKPGRKGAKKAAGGDRPTIRKTARPVVRGAKKGGKKGGRPPGGGRRGRG